MKLLKRLSILMMIVFACSSAKTIDDNEKLSSSIISNITPQELLKSKKWNIRGKSVDLYFEYTDTKELLYIDGNAVEEGEYYISDTNCFEQPFDVSKVGQTNSGRFLVTEDGCYYITVIDDSTIQISFLSNQNPVTTTLVAKE